MKTVMATVRTGFVYQDRNRMITPEDGTFPVDLDSDLYKSQEWKLDIPQEAKSDPQGQDEEPDTSTVPDELNDKHMETANNRAITRRRSTRSE